MSELLQHIAGWSGYLDRPAVIVQLLLALVPLLAAMLLERRLPKRRRIAASLRLGKFSLIGLGLLLLALARQPFGLALVVGMLALGWSGLNRLKQLLARFLDPQSLRQLDGRLLRPAYLLLATLLLINQLDSLQDLSVISLGSIFGTQLTLGSLLLSTTIVYLLVIGSGPPAAALAWAVQQAVDMRDGSRRALALMIHYVVVGLGILWAFDHIGFNPNAILAIAGGLSVGLGFGIKEVFSNFVSGLWLLFEGSVRPGEVLFIDGDPCEVRSLGLRAAVLWRDRDNAELVIPNQTFFTMTTTTYTGSDRMRRSQVLVGAAYRHEPSQVIALLEEVATSVPRVLPEPAPKALLLSYGDSSIDYALRFWIANPMDNVGICSEVNQAIWSAFEREGIEIPFPQQVQYVVEGQP